MHNSLESVRKAFSNLFYPLFIIGLVIWVGGFSYYNYYIVNLKPAVVSKIDATVVLTGGSKRIAKGLNLITKDDSKHLFISGVDAGVTVDDLVRGSKGSSLEKDKVELGYEAQNTRENAEESISWIKQNDYKSIRLITSNYHVPRSLLEFHELMPDLQIFIYPVEPDFFANHSRVTSFRKFVVLFREYNKLLVAIGRISYLKLRSIFS